MEIKITDGQNKHLSRFIILGQHRSGSTLLTLALREHPNIRMWGEILLHQPDLDGPEFLRPGEPGDEYLHNQIFGCKYEHRIKAVGFKVFYGHAQTDVETLKAWDYLFKDSSIAIIQLVRNNLFAQYVSFELAMRNDKWHHPVNDSVKLSTPKPIRIESVDCETYFEQEISDQNWALQKFASHKFMRVEYETNICGDFSKTYNEILNFIGVVPHNAGLHLSKMATEPLSHYVSNYKELREYFRRSKYERFFED
ncbi:MAG: hypothetical protein JSS76_00495 [Bacteroidetes bacterium]|nr:hypothetical protein [Bacteroidota bacterium]